MTGNNANDLLGLPVIATMEGRIMGRVKDVIFDPSEHQLLGVLVSRKHEPGGAAFLDRDSVRALGPHAVSVTREDDLRPLDANLRAKEVTESGIHLQSTPVLTELGEQVGQIREIII